MIKKEMENLINDTFFQLEIHQPLTKVQMIGKINNIFNKLLIKFDGDN